MKKHLRKKIIYKEQNFTYFLKPYARHRRKAIQQTVPSPHIKIHIPNDGPVRIVHTHIYTYICIAVNQYVFLRLSSPNSILVKNSH
jgi:hypothetical protein